MITHVILQGRTQMELYPPLAGNLIDAVNSGDNKRAVLEDSGFEFLEMFYG